MLLHYEGVVICKIKIFVMIIIHLQPQERFGKMSWQFTYVFMVALTGETDTDAH